MRFFRSLPDSIRAGLDRYSPSAAAVLGVLERERGLRGVKRSTAEERSSTQTLASGGETESEGLGQRGSLSVSSCCCAERKSSCKEETVSQIDLKCLCAVNTPLMNKSVLLAAAQNESMQPHEFILTET